MMANDAVFEKVLSENPGAFAILQRPEAGGEHMLEVLLGDVSVVDTLADIPLSNNQKTKGVAQHDALALVPYQQIKERGFVAREDDTPLVVLSVTEQGMIAQNQALKLLPNQDISLEGQGFDIPDKDYTRIVENVLSNEIGNGAGSNFVIKRAFTAEITDYSLAKSLSLFRRLLEGESGAYWTFIVHTGDSTIVGATPERHVSLRDEQAVMNPISGTYRYPEEGANVAAVLDFLEDPKETDELYMVLDEELKMMAQVCDGGGQVVGPFLREMTRLAHTEYYIEGTSTRDPRSILKDTMLAPTVTGSPLENACRVIAKYETEGRGYYSGIATLIGRGANGKRTMDSAIMIRSAEIAGENSEIPGQLKIGVGATLVRHSDAASEVAETHAKVAGILSALSPETPLKSVSKTLAPRLSADPDVSDALLRRNTSIAKFWLNDPDERQAPKRSLNGLKTLVVDAEDNFTFMLAHQLRALGLQVEVKKFDDHFWPNDYDLVVLGPGPGDPRDRSDIRIKKMSNLVDRLLVSRRPFLSVCLSHQIVSRRLGLKLQQRDVPNQGAQRTIELFGSERKVGFYNSYCAHANTESIDPLGVGEVSICRDRKTGEVHALRGPHFSTIQFHVESVLTQSGPEILAEMITPLMAKQRRFVS